ncbi:MAG TPA: sigma-70 family RNA polymerase sigma factor [Acidimicrobiales bacterium]|nr:sigma-70 family RNA polymerase sigma factor [Acidimicrobiales bacterium]
MPTWQEIADRYGDFLYTVAYRLTGDRHDADDLVQETLLRVRRGLPGYRPGSMEGWLTRIATNAFIDSTRRRARRPQTPLTVDHDALGPAAPGADHAYEATRLSGDVQRALAALPVEYRLPVVLCDVAGRSYEEIAQTLHVPVGTVRSRIHRGRARLRELLG